MNTSDIYSLSVFFNDVAEIVFITIAALQVLAAGEKSVVLSDWSNSNNRSFFNSCGGESFVDTCAECNIVEELLGVVSFILLCQCFLLLVGQFEIQLTKNAAELGLGNVSLTEFVEVVEELFNSYTLHNDRGSQAIFDVGWIVGYFNAGLSVAVGKHIDVVGFLVIERRGLGGGDASCPYWCGNSILWGVAWEDVFWSVQVFAELVVINFSGCSTVTVSSDD